MKIILSEHVGTHCASIDDGQKVYRLLARILHEKEMAKTFQAFKIRVM